jgi:hypothetical protein
MSKHNADMYSEAFWCMTCVYVLDRIGAPWWVPLILMVLWAALWIASAYVGVLERRAHSGDEKHG